MEKLKSSVFFVEANDFERHMLWNRDHEKYDWVEDSSGKYFFVGNVKGTEHPVYVSCSYAEILGQRVCFYYPSGTWVDWDLIDAWLMEKSEMKRYDDGSRWPKCDAMNFHMALFFCSENQKVNNGK